MLPFIVIISSVRFFSPVCTPPIGVLSFFSHFFGSETTEEEGKKKMKILRVTVIASIRTIAYACVVWL